MKSQCMHTVFLEKKGKPLEAKQGCQTSVEDYRRSGETKKKRCEGAAGDKKNVDRLEVKKWCSQSEVKRAGEKGEAVNNKVEIQAGARINRSGN